LTTSEKAGSQAASDLTPFCEFVQARIKPKHEPARRAEEPSLADVNKRQKIFRPGTLYAFS